MTDGTHEFEVIIEPDNILLSCRPGETLIACAWRHGYYWPTICGSVGECGACRCDIVSGKEKADAANAVEEIFFRSHPRIRQASPATRLACCLTLAGPVTVSKRGVKKK